MRHTYILAIILIMLSPAMLLTDDDNQIGQVELIEEIDISEQDTIAIREIDTLKIHPNRQHGSFLNYINNIGETEITKNDARFDSYYSTEDIINRRIFSMPMQLGFPAQKTYMSVLGALPKDIDVRYNSRTVFSPELNYSDINRISPEFYENITIYNGSIAAVLSGKTTMMNFNERMYNTAKPYTKMWYTQSGYGIIGAEGIFSQNFHPRWNISVGFKNIAGDGNYDNSAVEHWNLRSVLRYNPDDYESFSISYNFNNHKEGRNGGVNTTSSQDPANPLDAFVNYRSLAERIYSTDFTFTYSNVFDDLRTKNLLANVFYSYSETQMKFRNEPTLLHLDSSGRKMYVSQYVGTNIIFETNIVSSINMTIGGDLYFVDIGNTLHSEAINFVHYAAFALASYKLSPNVTASAGGRIQRYFDNDMLSFGFNFAYNPSDKLKYYADFTRSESSPNIIQGSDKPKEVHYLATTGFSWLFGDSRLKTYLFYRRINNPLISEVSLDRLYVLYSDDCNCNSMDIMGSEIDFKSVLFGKIHYNAKATLMYSMTNEEYDELYPALTLYGDAYYQYNVGNSIFRGGVEAMLASPFKGYGFYPITGDFTRFAGRSKWMGNGLNAYVALRLGNAFLRLSFDNLLAQNYYYVKTYPMTGRMFRLSLSWAFDD